MRGLLVQRRFQRGGLGALLVCLLALSGCQFFWQSSLPQLPKGWGWYHDSVYPFDLPVPAGWQAFGYWTEVTQGDHCYRTVDLIPATEEQQYRSDPFRIFERISLSVAVNPNNCARDPNPVHSPWKVAGATTLGGKAATLYTNVNNAADFDLRLVVASFGGRHYSLDFYDEKSSFLAPIQQFQQLDAGLLRIYDIVRKNFTYHG